MFGSWASRVAVVACLSLATAGPTAQARALPATREIRDAEALVRDVYKDLYARHDIESRRALGRRLLDDAQGTRDSPAARLVMLREARSILAGVGDVAAAVRAGEIMAADFALDPLGTRIETLIALAGTIDETPLRRFVQECIDAADAAVFAERFDEADRVVQAAVRASGRLHSVTEGNRAREAAEDLAATRRLHADAAVAMRHIAAGNAPSPAQRAAAGRYLCLVRGQWQAGIEMLTSVPGELAEPVRIESNGPATPEEKMLAGNAWWSAADAAKGLQRRNMRQRAGHWYSAAIPKLAGLSLTKAQQRLGELDAEQMRRLRMSPGLRADLFKGTEFKTRLLTRIDPGLEFDWGKEAPGEGLPKDNFSIRWTGHLRIDHPGKYRFNAFANSGIKLQIDKNTLIDNPLAWRKRAGETAEIELPAGLHRITIEYFDTTGDAKIKIQWQPPGSKTPEPIPPRALVHDDE